MGPPDYDMSGVEAAEWLEGQRAVDRSKPHWMCRCGAVAMPLTNYTVCYCKDLYEQEWGYVDPTEGGEMSTDKDYVDLILIEHWLDANGWDKLGTEQMYEWMDGEGMRRDELTVIRCQMPDYA